LEGLDFENTFTKGFKPPGWYLGEALIDACNEKGLWIACHGKDEVLISKIICGHYICGEKFDYWHGHARDICGNWIVKDLLMLKERWPREQRFGFISEAVLNPKNQWMRSMTEPILKAIGLE
jgi:hypothetical protein